MNRYVGIGVFCISLLASVAMSAENYERRPLAANELQGGLVNAIVVAFNDLTHRDDFAPHERLIEHYTVFFSETATDYQIEFMAKRAPEEAGIHSGHSKYGRDIGYIIDKKTHTIKKTFFSR
jgi:hypothetical protein